MRKRTKQKEPDAKEKVQGNKRIKKNTIKIMAKLIKKGYSRLIKSNRSKNNE
jgi:hypothetical protein